MSDALFLVEGDDPGAAMLATALRRYGWRTGVLDLRFSRPTLDAAGDVPVVRVDGRPAEPTVVVNRSATSGLGLAPPAALDRQLPVTWSGRHLAAREEQGLLLACLDVWDQQSRLYNPVRTLDRRLLRPAVEVELRARGVAICRPPDTAVSAPRDRRRGVCWIVDGTVVASFARRADGRWATTPLSENTTAQVARLADVAGLRLGQVDLWQQRGDPQRGGPTFVSDWHVLPRFRSWWERTGTDVADLVVAAMGGVAPVAAPDFLSGDLEPNLLSARRPRA